MSDIDCTKLNRKLNGLAMNGKAVEVSITPIKTDLKDVVEVSKAGIAMNMKSSPDPRADTSDHSFQLVDNRI